jgi:integrase
MYYVKLNARGHEITRSLETTDLPEARQRLAELRASRSRLDPGNGRIVLATLVEKYRATFAHQKPKTRWHKALVMRRVLEAWPTRAEDTPIAKIKPSDCAAWLSSFNFSPRNHNGHSRILRALFGLAMHDKVLSENPAEHLKKVKVPRPIRLTPSFQQFQMIVANVRAQKFNGHDPQESANFLEFLGLAGLGQAEARSLTRSDVDFEAGRIVTFRHKTSTGFAIPLYPQVRPLLERVCAGKRHDERLFSIRDAKRALAASCRRLNFPRFSQRSLRRMFVTMAIERGIDVKTIASFQGHKDGGALILKTYSHIRPEHAQAMALRMN